MGAAYDTRIFSSQPQPTASLTFSASCDIEGTRSPSRHVAANSVVLRDVGDNLGDRCLSWIRTHARGPHLCFLSRYRHALSMGLVPAT